jgi:hypothetical protein
LIALSISAGNFLSITNFRPAAEIMAAHRSKIDAAIESVSMCERTES